MAAAASRPLLVLPDFSSCEELKTLGTPDFPIDMHERVSQLISRIRPATHSDERRTRVTEYMKDLITDCFSSLEVCFTLQTQYWFCH